MKNVHLIIDGNNLIHHDRELVRLAASHFDQARYRLLMRLSEIAGTLSYAKITVVFDGRGGSVSSESPSPYLEVMFSPANLTADTVIERLAHESQTPADVLVVTSDRSERDTVEAAGASTMGCSNFLELLEQQRREVAGRTRGTQRKDSGGRLGDFFPES